MGSYLGGFYSNPMEEVEVKEENFHSCTYGDPSDLEMGNYETRTQTPDLQPKFPIKKFMDDSDCRDYEEIEISTIEIETIKIEKIRIEKNTTQTVEIEGSEMEMSESETSEDENEDSPPITKDEEIRFKPNLSPLADIHHLRWNPNEKFFTGFGPRPPNSHFIYMNNKHKMEMEFLKAMKNGNIERAFIITDKMIELFGPDRQLDIRKIDFLISMRKLSEAEKMLRDMEDVKNNFTELTCFRSLIKYQRGELDLALEEISISVCSSLIGFVPQRNIHIYSTIEKRISEILQYEKKGRSDIAKNLFCSARKNFILAVDKNRSMKPYSIVVHAKLYHLIAYCSYKLADFVDAIKYSQDVLKIYPKFESALIFKTLSFIRLELFEDALDVCVVLMELERDPKKYLEKKNLSDHIKELKIKDENRCYYSVLGVSRKATAEEIKNAFKRKMRTHHPDRHVTCVFKQKRQTEIFKLAQRAYDVLINSSIRKYYDEEHEDLDEVSDTESFMEYPMNEGEMNFDF